MSSIKDVAKLAGVSISTVSHVVNSTRFVSEETASKVREAMATLDYRPNMAALSLRTKKSKTFAYCTDRAYALPCQNDMWAAGMFQGEGEGFGVWLRDSTHIAMRCGNLIDPATARRTLLYTANKGFDNGSDGPAMGAVGLWDYYIVTNDESAIYEAWSSLLNNIERTDELFDESRQLVKAGQSTSNDAFDEPENGGYSLGAQTYYCRQYEAMAAMGSIIGYDNKAVLQWSDRSESMKRAIKELFWNAEKDMYTSGPKGTEAYTKGFWEGAGAESMVWSRFELATPDRLAKSLKAMKRIAMTPYGIKLFPYRQEKNHFFGAVWVVWESGFADAASAAGDINLVRQLIAQQVRNSVINKTFFEVVDSDTGKSWRWPGQLWHAAGFISLIYYGVFGIKYGQAGMYFTPAVPQELANCSLSSIHFGDAVFDISVEGHGKGGRVILDGEDVDYIPNTLTGRHKIRLVVCDTVI